ncbi:hypothetical protein D2U88_02765 [Flagellimonas aequoris]|uniref:Uncharacterized protein n=1 Tax=Flagellimonas aequoris TaxID=2306997 RepID=A0A418NCM3_9FLAO|nr:hypothetical protein D2U88_02765 [Allomuricauda aequoris]
MENDELKNIRSWFGSLPEKRKFEIHQAARLTYNSCAIEGNSLSENETFNLIVSELYKREVGKSNKNEKSR